MPSFARRGITPLLGLLAPFILALPASAQGIRVVPQAGMFANALDAPPFDPGTLFSPDEMGRSPTAALGLALEMDVPVTSLPLFVRAGGVYGFESDVPLRGFICIESPCTSVSASILGLAGDVGVSIPARAGIRPYILGGVGFKRWLVNREVGAGPFVESESRFAGHLGAGLEMALGPVGLTLEVSDWITGAADQGHTSFGENDARHDVFVMMGVSLTR